MTAELHQPSRARLRRPRLHVHLRLIAQKTFHQAAPRKPQGRDTSPNRTAALDRWKSWSYFTHNALRSSGTSPNFFNTVASLKSPVAGSAADIVNEDDLKIGLTI